MITKSLTEPGVYGSGTPALPARDWRRQVAHIRRLPALEQRLEQIEKKLMLQPKSGEANEPDNF
jgi:UDP-3-O-[3-hydroxymyristoyl] glucosamine N-acyltransferase